MNAPATLPEHLAEIWEEIVADLSADVELTTSDRTAVESLVGQVHIARDARARVQADGMMVRGAKDEPVAHPALAVGRAAEAEIRKWGDVRRYARRARTSFADQSNVNRARARP